MTFRNIIDTIACIVLICIVAVKIGRMIYSEIKYGDNNNLIYLFDKYKFDREHYYGGNIIIFESDTLYTLFLLQLTEFGDKFTSFIIRKFVPWLYTEEILRLNLFYRYYNFLEYCKYEGIDYLDNTIKSREFDNLLDNLRYLLLEYIRSTGRIPLHPYAKYGTASSVITGIKQELDLKDNVKYSDIDFKIKYCGKIHWK